jgi:hypothetical protein
VLWGAAQRPGRRPVHLLVCALRLLVCHSRPHAPVITLDSHARVCLFLLTRPSSSTPSSAQDYSSSLIRPSRARPIVRPWKLHICPAACALVVVQLCSKSQIRNSSLAPWRLPPPFFRRNAGPGCAPGASRPRAPTGELPLLAHSPSPRFHGLYSNDAADERHQGTWRWHHRMLQTERLRRLLPCWHSHPWYRRIASPRPGQTCCMLDGEGADGRCSTPDPRPCGRCNKILMMEEVWRGDRNGGPCRRIKHGDGG